MAKEIHTTCKHNKIDKTKINEKLSYHRCQFCGHCELLTMVNRRDSFELSQKKFFSTNLDSLNGVVSEQESIINQHRIKVIKKWSPPNCDILEVGPGMGLLANHLVKEGFKVSLLEHSEILAIILNQNKNFTVYTGEFEKTSIAPDTFDTFCSFHVIEHVIDPIEHLHTAFSLVKPGGIAYIATPNANSWQQRLLPKLSPNFDSAHLRVYSLTSLKDDCRNAGWEVLELRTPAYVSSWIRLITKALRRLKGEDEEITAGKYATNQSVFLSLIIKIIIILTHPFCWLQSYLMGGNEIFIILRKPI